MRELCHAYDTYCDLHHLFLLAVLELYWQAQSCPLRYEKFT